MAEHNSTQYAKQVAGRPASPPDAGGDMQMLRFHFKAPAGGVAVSDLINFGTIKPGMRFNPADARVHWEAGTATADLNLGHKGFSNIDDDGVVADIAADADEFLVAADLGSANITGSAMVNARKGGIYVSDRKADLKTKSDGLFLQGQVLTAGMPAGQEIVVEIPVYAA